MNFPIGDFLIRLKNASMVKQKEVVVPATKMIRAVAKALEKEGYLSEVKQEGGKIIVKLAYKRKEAAFTNVKLISKPGLRIYVKVNDLEKRRKPSILIISTPKGVMTSGEALKKRLGGEAIAEVL